MTILSEVAGFPLVHELMPDVITQVIVSLLAGIKENKELFVPALVPFTFH
jgi:hypothetical protein